MSDNKKSNKLLIAIIGLLVITILLGGFIAWQMIATNSERQQEEANGLFIALEEDPNVFTGGGSQSIDELIAEMQEKVDKGSVEINMNNIMTISKADKVGKIYIENPLTNHYDMFVTIFLDETQEKIGQTGIVPLGASIEQINIDAELAEGQYSGIVVYNMLDENKQVVEQANVGVTINVQ